MDIFEQQTGRYIELHRLPPSPARLVVALSGGADSVALLAVLTALGYDCVAAHCNFHLRGDESMRDRRHAEAVSGLLGVDLCVKDFDVEARRRATGESVEMACRELRYAWFADLIDRQGARAVAVGHHREDVLETFFINLLRGTGIGGLTGIRPQQGMVVRPLLEASRADIEAYLRRRGLTWVDDSTNATDDFLRNRLRHRLLPLLDELKAGGADSVLRTMAMLGENRAFYDRAVRRRGAGYTDADTGDIDLKALALDPDGPLLLFEMLRGEGFTRRQTDDMLAAAARSGGSFYAGAAVRSVDHGCLRGARAAGAPAAGCFDVSLLHDICEPVRIEITRHGVAEFKPEGDPRVIYIDESALEGAPRWQLRPWRRGDRLEPYGMSGSKLVSDIFAQGRLTAADKDSTWLLWRDDTLMWVVGHRASRHFAVGPDTRRYLRLKLND